jgi:hypothetical protein
MPRQPVSGVPFRPCAAMLLPALLAVLTGRASSLESSHVKSIFNMWVQIPADNTI